jgi:hypothetical protein
MAMHRMSYYINVTVNMIPHALQFLKDGLDLLNTAPHFTNLMPLPPDIGIVAVRMFHIDDDNLLK